MARGELCFRFATTEELEFCHSFTPSLAWLKFHSVHRDAKKTAAHRGWAKAEVTQVDTYYAPIKELRGKKSPNSGDTDTPGSRSPPTLGAAL